MNRGCRYLFRSFPLNSVQFSHSVLSDSLRPHGLQHAGPPCPSPTPGVHPHPCPLSRWCHPTISSSVVPFSSRLQSFPASGSFQMSQLFTPGGESIGVSASASVFPMNTQDWSPLGLTGWISLQFKELSRVFSNTTVQKYQFFGAQLSLYSNSHIHRNIYTEVGLPGHIVILFLIFWRTSTVAAPTYIPIDSARGFQFLVFSLLDSSHFDRREVLPHCGFSLHFPDDQWCWHIFIYLLAICVSCLAKIVLVPLPV